MLNYATAKHDARQRVFFGIGTRHSALCQVLTFKRPLLRNDICICRVAQIRPHPASLPWAVLRTDDSPCRDYRWSADVRAARDRSWQFLRPPQTSSCIFHNCIRRGRFIFLRERLLHRTWLSQMGLSSMLRNLRLQSQLKQRRHLTCFP